MGLLRAETCYTHSTSIQRSGPMLMILLIRFVPVVVARLSIIRESIFACGLFVFVGVVWWHTKRRIYVADGVNNDK